ncbi:serine hydrolase domain-containing protein [Saccharibacillus sp. CPCC 101409]|uniref:serine hydrolase domain-containing protein n=1 Tax=Saccharibacillus sp. CPCC 101409 TaxID=3058041 RepID=UPI002672E9EF|nr:serine hydrolase domain-containing protein [Saccharibacillus sp. CPCC 101409]MDO3409235.1 serine hydrolase domain-containing protein [Saccharibacillus sp. CPCC 101409]
MLEPSTIDRLKQTLETGIARGEIAGANLMVIQSGRETFYHEDGLADIENQRSIARDSIFRLYSMTKPMTAAAVMILLERGEIDLFDPVSRYLPGFRGQQVEQGGKLTQPGREVTIHDLLNMTSGLVYGGDDLAGRHTEALLRDLDSRLHGDNPVSTLEFANRLGEGPLSFEPGSSWQYGTSADVLGAIVETAGGLRFGEFLQQEIFGPLDMRDTGFWLPEDKRGRLAKTYQNDGESGLSLYAGDHLGIVHQLDRQPAFESGGAGLASTIDDAAKFTTMLMNGGELNGTKVLNPRTVQYLTSATLTARQQQNFDGWHSLAGHSYGNQMRIMTDPGQAGLIGSAGEYGWDGWLGAYFVNSPQDKLTFLFMVQKRDAGTLPITRKLRNIVFGAL